MVKFNVTSYLTQAPVKKSLVNGNPLYKEIPHTVKQFIQGEPLVNVRGNHLQRERLASASSSCNSNQMCSSS